MKKILSLLLVVFVLLSSVACKDGGNENEVDVDLTQLSDTVAYGFVSQMWDKPEQYIGKTVKMSGPFSVYHDTSTDHYYFACLFSDTTACCSQSIEFVLKGSHSYPSDYPAKGSEITVQGTFGTYYEGDNFYCQLSDAQIVDE